MAKAVPLLEELDLSRVDDKPFFGRDAVMALPYFHNLKSLKLDGFFVRRNAGRGKAFFSFFLVFLLLLYLHKNSSFFFQYY